MYAVRQNGYGPRVGQTPQGYPIFLYTDPRSKIMSYVVVQPDGRAYYSDSQGRNVGKPHGAADAAIAGAMIGGMLGAIAGPAVAMFGAVVAGQALDKRAA